METKTTTMVKEKDCVHSIKFTSEGQGEVKPAIADVYIMRKGLPAINGATKIEVTVKILE